ncbi:MAG: hypothetical protein KBA66_04470 [Leptospiraceae bacterium]|nr:hypothetical protein [Leptospiraceae bacterium]
MRNSIVLYFLVCCLVSFQSLFSVDFDDIKEKEGKVYGSEKDKRYVIDAFFVEWENYPRSNPTHNSFHFFWVANTTSYPKYTKNYFFPFYYLESSKVDQRYEANHLLLSHYQKEANGSYSYRLYPFVWVGNQKEDSYYNAVFPLYYASSTNSGGQKEKRILFPGFYQSSFEDSEKKEADTVSVSPFHFYTYSKSNAGEVSQFGFPALPLFYSSSDSNSTHRNYLWVFDTEFDTKKNSYSRVWLAPFVFWKQGSYLNILPFYFFDTSSENKSNTVYGLLPPFYYSYTPEQNTFYLLNFYSSTKSTKNVSESFTSLVPFYFRSSNNKGYSQTIVPGLFYSETEEDKSNHKNILLVYDQTTDNKGNLDRILALPFFYYKKDSSLYIAPFYFNSANNNGYSQTIVPGIFYSETEEDKSNHKNILLAYDQSNNKEGKLDRLFISPFYYYKKDSYFHIAPFYFSTSSKDDRYGGWFGIFPPAYSSYSPTHKTFYLVNFYSSTVTSKDTIENFTTFAPFYFQSSNNKGYSRTLIPVLYYSHTKEDSSNYKNILVLYSQTNDNKGNLDKLFISPLLFYQKDYFLHIAPFYWSWVDSKSNEKLTEVNRRTLILPIVYREKNADTSSYTNILGLVSRQYDKKGNLEASMYAPFYFYKRDEYDIIFPFTFKFGPDEEAKDTGTRWGLFYYNNWNKDEKTLWIANWFSHHDKVNDTYFRSLNPIYYNWKTKESSGEVSPMYLSIQFANQDRFHLNLAGYSSNVASGVMKPDVNVNTGEKQGYKYLDTDVSWLWYVFRMSTRTSTKTFYDLETSAKDFLENKETVADSKEANTALSPKISKKKNFTRDDSLNFFSVNVLFGLYGWEAGDSKRHIRAFPLAWFTWDTKSNDRVYTVPPLFVHYDTEDVKYTVLFPFYGTQKTPEAERTAYGLIGYISESIKENRAEEKSILWPLANWHSSDVKSGSRILPFYWYRNRTEGRDKISTLISPLFYYNNTLDRKGTEDAYVLSPLWFRFYTRQTDESSDFHFTLPIYFYKQNQSKYEKNNLFVSLPFIYYGTADTHNNSVYNRTFWMVPILALYNSDNFGTNWNSLLIVNSIESKDNSNFVFFPVYYHDIDYDKNRVTSITRWIFPAFYKKDYAKNALDKETTTLYSPLLVYESSENTSKKSEDTSWFAPIPLLYHSYKSANDESYWNWLLFSSYEKSKTAHNIKIYPIFYQDFYEQDPKNYNYTNWFVPFYYWNDTKKTTLITNEEEGTTKTISESEFSFYSPLGFYTNHNNTNKKWFAPIPLIYHSYEQKNEKSYWNIMLLSSYQDSNTLNNLQILPLYLHDKIYEKGKLLSVTRWIFPAYYKKDYAKKSGDSETTSLYSPLLVYESSENASKNIEDTTWFAPIPLLYHSYKSVNDESYWNWFLFSSYEKSKTAHNIKVYPIFYQDFYEQDSRNYNYTNWFLPFYYWNDTKKTTLVKNEEEGTEKKISESEFSFYSPFAFYTNQNGINKKWFVPIPFVYHSYQKKNERSYWNIMALASYEDSNDSNSLQVLPFYLHDKSYDKGKLASVTRWILPAYYKKDYSKKTGDAETTTLYSPLLIYEASENASKKSEDTTWFAPIPLLYHSYKSVNDESYWNWLLFSSYEKSKTAHNLKIYPIFYKDFYEQDPNNYNYTSWFAPFYYSSDTKKTILVKNEEEGTTKKISESEFSFYSPLWMYTNQNNTDKKWILPLALAYHSESPSESYYSWLGLMNKEKTKTKSSFSFYPVASYESEEKKEDLVKTSFWMLPLFFYKKENNKSLKQVDDTLLSLLYTEYGSETKAEGKKSYDRSILFPIIPFLYYENITNDSENSTVLSLFHHSYKNKKLTKRVIFPYWYSLDTDNDGNPVEYTSFLPVYFSSESKNSKSSFVAGLYQSSDLKSSVQNFLLLAENKYSNESGKRELDFLFRAVHIANAKEEVNVKILYGLGNYSNNPQETNMNLLWISSKAKKEYAYNNMLPLYYSEKTKSEKETWIAPTLYYSKTSEKENTEHAGLGTLYYKNSDHVKKEEHLNMLMGVLYYKTSIPKERGYEGSGSLWGLLWEYKTESETKYSKFAILKFVYTKTTDETGESYQRILGVRL